MKQSYNGLLCFIHHKFVSCSKLHNRLLFIILKNKYVFYFRTVAAMVIFSQYLGRYSLPCFTFVKTQGCVKQKYPVFKMFPVSYFCYFIYVVRDYCFSCLAVQNINIILKYFKLNFSVLMYTFMDNNIYIYIHTILLSVYRSNLILKVG